MSDKNNINGNAMQQRPSSVAITLQPIENDDDTLVTTNSVNIARMRTPTHSPLTPVGTPELKPRSAESFHKKTPSGRTIDIMILPKDQSEVSEMPAVELPCTESPKNIEEEDGKQQNINGTTDGPIDERKTEFEGMTGHDFLANLPKGISACPFLEHGCHKVGNDMEVKLHIRDDRILHLVLLCRAVIELKRIHIENLRERPFKIAQLEKQLAPAYSIVKKYGPQCIFHIPRIHNVIQDARKNGRKLIFSQPFETHRFGYKMTVMVAPYGDAEVARQYISVYVTIIRSDYDPIQRWPFSLPVTFTMLAADPVNNLEKTFTPNPIPENNPFLGRPQGARNAAFGIQRFCELSDLNKYTIRNDLFLSVHVDLTPLHDKRTPRIPSDDL